MRRIILHHSRMGRLNRKQQGLVLGLCLFLGIIGILALTHAAMPEPRCTRAFPRWIGCVFGRHESLAGGLIAAAGALFAAWLVWSGIRQQLDESRRARTDALLQGLRWREQELLRNVRGLMHTREYVARLSRAFENAEADDGTNFADRLRKLERAGDLVAYQGDPAPDGLSLRAQRCYQALQSLRQRAGQRGEGGRWGGDGNDGIAFEADLLQTIAQLRELAGEIDSALPRYQADQRQIRTEIERTAMV
jgi:hypothetical protein